MERNVNSELGPAVVPNKRDFRLRQGLRRDKMVRQACVMRKIGVSLPCIAMRSEIDYIRQLSVDEFLCYIEIINS